MYSPPRKRSHSNDPSCCSTLTKGLCKKSKQSNGRNDKREVQKNYEDKRAGHEVRRIVKNIQRVSRFLPLAITSTCAFEPGRKDCETCNLDQQEYKKTMRTLKMVDILASRAIEKEQAEMFDGTESRWEEENKSEQRNEGKLRINVGVFCEKRVPDHSLKCILFNLQNHLAYLIVQIAFVKTKHKENEPRYRHMIVTAAELQVIRFECSALTDKVIALLKGGGEGARRDVGVCVGCVKQELAECSERLESALEAGSNMVLVVRNDRPGQCCLRDYAHVHAQAHGQPIVLKYTQPFTKASERNRPAASTIALPGSRFQSPREPDSISGQLGNSGDEPVHVFRYPDNEPRSETRNSYQPSILRKSIPRDRGEYPNIEKLSVAESEKEASQGSEFDDRTQQNTHSSYRKPSIFLSSIPEDKEQEYSERIRLSEVKSVPEIIVEDDPHTTTVCSHDSHRKSTIQVSIPGRKGEDYVKRKMSQSETAGSSTVEIKDPRTDTLGTYSSRRKSSVPCSSELDEPRSPTEDTHRKSEIPRNPELAEPRRSTVDTHRKSDVPRSSELSELRRSTVDTHRKSDVPRSSELSELRRSTVDTHRNSDVPRSSELAEPRSGTVNTQKSQHKPEPSISKITDPHSATLNTLSSHSKSVPSSAVLYFHKEEENPVIKELPKETPETKTSTQEKTHNLLHDPHTNTLTSQKSYRKSNEQSKTRSSMKTLSKAETDSIVTTDDDLNDFSSDISSLASSNDQSQTLTKTLSKSESHTKASAAPHTDTVSSQKSYHSNDQQIFLTSTKTSSDAKSGISVNTVKTPSSHSKSSSVKALTKTPSNIHSPLIKTSSSKFSSFSQLPDLMSDEDTKDKDDNHKERRPSRLSHVSFKEPVSDSSFDSSGSFPSYLEEEKKPTVTFQEKPARLFDSTDETKKSNSEVKRKETPFPNPSDVPVYLVAMDSVIMTKHKMSQMNVKGSKQEMYDPHPPDPAVVNAYKRFLGRPEYESQVTEPTKTSNRKRTSPKTSKKYLKVQNAEPEIYNIENRTSIKNTKPESIIENGTPNVKSTEPYKSDIDINKLEDLLDFLGRENLLKANTPADCCLARNLEDVYGCSTANIPLRPSLDSLPLSKTDMMYLAQQLGVDIDPESLLLVVEEDPNEQRCEWEQRFAGEVTEGDKTKWQRAMDARARHSHSKQPFLPIISEEPSTCSIHPQVSTDDMIQVKTSLLPLIPNVYPMCMTDEDKKAKSLRKRKVQKIKRQRTTELRYFTVEFPSDVKNEISKSLPQHFRNKESSTRFPAINACDESFPRLDKFHSCFSFSNDLVSEVTKIKGRSLNDSVETCWPLRTVDEMIMLNTIYLDSSKNDKELISIWKTPLNSFPKLYQEDVEQKMCTCRLNNFKELNSSGEKTVNIEQAQHKLYQISKSTPIEDEEKEKKNLSTSSKPDNNVTESFNTLSLNTLYTFNERINCKEFHKIDNKYNGNKPKTTKDAGEGDTKDNHFQGISSNAQGLQLNKSYTIFKGHTESDICSIIKNINSSKKKENKIDILERPYDNNYSPNKSNSKNKKTFRKHDKVPFKKPKNETTIPVIHNRKELYTINSDIRQEQGLTEAKRSNWLKLRIDNVNVKNYIAENKKLPSVTNFNEFRNMYMKERKRKPCVFSYPSIECRRFQYHIKLPELKFVNLNPILSNLQSPTIICSKQSKPKLVSVFQNCGEEVKKGQPKSLFNIKNNKLNIITYDNNLVAVQQIPESIRCMTFNGFNIYKKESITNGMESFNKECKKYSTLKEVNRPKLDVDSNLETVQNTTKSIEDIKLNCFDYNTESKQNDTDNFNDDKYWTHTEDNSPKLIVNSNLDVLRQTQESIKGIKSNCIQYSDETKITQSDNFNNVNKYSTLIVVNSPNHSCDKPFLKRSLKSSNCPDTSNYFKRPGSVPLCESNQTRLLDANCDPLLLFDARGRPLTDSAGRLLCDIDGRCLTVWDEAGTPIGDVYGGKIYDHLGRSLSDENFYPAKKEESEIRIFKTLTSPSGDPMRLYDWEGLPLNSVSGTMLTDRSGTGLIRFRRNGHPCSDIAGGPLYDKLHKIVP